MSQTSNQNTRYQSFAEFWPFYLSQHQNPTCRRLHYLGSSLGILALVAGLIYSAKYILFAMLLGYALAWIGHFVFEKNRPATFQYPLWSFLADFKMLALWIKSGFVA